MDVENATSDNIEPPCAPETNMDIDTAEVTTNETASAELVPPLVDETLKTQLLSMGFGEHRIVRALHLGKSQNTESVITWIEEHKDDPDIDEPLLVSSNDVEKEKTDDGVTRSWRCVETGKLFKSMRSVELYAERTGRSNFEESSEEVKPLTAEEKQQKKLEIKARIARIRNERELREKKEKLEKERKRRREGQIEGVMKEEGIVMQRKRVADEKKREKLKKERERLRLELAKDKAERLAAKAIREGREPPAEVLALAGVQKVNDKIRGAANALTKFERNGNGKKALKICRIYVRNARDKGILPGEEGLKFRCINLANKTYQEKVAAFRGGKQLLYAAGFEKQPSSETYPSGSLVISPESASDKIWLTEVIEVIEDAMKKCIIR